MELLSAFVLFTTLISSSSAKNDPSDQCGVYLAESSTDHTLGTFAGRAYERDDTIGSSDAIVQIVDIRFHNKEPEEETDGILLERFLGTLWSGDANEPNRAQNRTRSTKRPPVSLPPQYVLIGNNFIGF